MISKAQIKLLRQLNQKKYRDEYGLFIAEGPKVVNELMNSHYKLKEIHALSGYQLSNTKYKVQEVTQKELEQISFLTAPNEVLGVFEIPPSTYRQSSIISQLVLALDDIRDPGNLGTMIRIADWFGIKNILCSETCVDVYNSKVVQGSMGSIARVNIHYVKLENALKEFEPIYGAVMDGKNIYTEKFSSKGVILIGNESRGISEGLLPLITNKISIPRFSDKTDSLNAAIAAAIICSEFKRR